MDWRIEVVTVPVSDVDRARDFYAEKVGFTVDIDGTVGDGARFVQLTPPGSACSIHLAQGTEGTKAGDLDGVFLVVPDVRVAREELAGRGVEVGGVRVFDDGAYRPACEGEGLDLVGFAFFRDPDGNRWRVQQIPARD